MQYAYSNDRAHLISLTTSASDTELREETRNGTRRALEIGDLRDRRAPYREGLIIRMRKGPRNRNGRKGLEPYELWPNACLPRAMAALCRDSPASGYLGRRQDGLVDVAVRKAFPRPLDVGESRCGLWRRCTTLRPIYHL